MFSPGAARALRKGAALLILIDLNLSIGAFVVNVDSSGQTRRWTLSHPGTAVSTNIVNPATKAVRYFIAADAYSSTNRLAEIEAVRASFDQWQSVPGTALRFEEGGFSPPGRDVHTSDQTNLVFWAKTSTLVNGGRDNISGALAVTFPRISSENLLLEADIVLNGVQFDWFTDYLAPPHAAQFIEATVTHEIGHLIGLDHSPVGGATLFARGATGRSIQAGLSWDERTAARALYPAPDLAASLAQVQGRITGGGTPLFGASLVVEDSHGNILAGTMSRQNGDFELPGLPAEDLVLRAAPLDPASSARLARLVTGRDIAPAFSAAETAFLPSTNIPLALRPGETTQVNVSVVRSAPALRIARILLPDSDELQWSAMDSPASIGAGQGPVYLGVFVTQAPGPAIELRITGAGIELSPAKVFLDAFPGASPPLHLVSARAHITPQAAPGLRSFFLREGTNQAYATGFLEIAPSFPDDNFDGLDDRFQRRNFARFTDPAAAPAADPDADGFLNINEFLAGTDPRNPAEALRIESLARERAQTAIRWQTKPGKRYQLRRRLQWGASEWESLGLPILATEPLTEFFDRPPGGEAFYQIQLLP